MDCYRWQSDIWHWPLKVKFDLTKGHIMMWFPINVQCISHVYLASIMWVVPREKDALGNNVIFNKINKLLNKDFNQNFEKVRGVLHEKLLKSNIFCLKVHKFGIKMFIKGIIILFHRPLHQFLYHLFSIQIRIYILSFIFNRKLTQFFIGFL